MKWFGRGKGHKEETEKAPCLPDEGLVRAIIARLKTELLDYEKGGRRAPRLPSRMSPVRIWSPAAQA